MTNAVGGDAVLQGACDVLLADHIIKAGGPPFAVEGLGHGASLPIRQRDDKQGGMLWAIAFALVRQMNLYQRLKSRPVPTEL